MPKKRHGPEQRPPLHKDSGVETFDTLLQRFDRCPNERAVVSRQLWAINPKLWQHIQEAREAKQAAKQVKRRSAAKAEQQTAELLRRQRQLQDIQKARWKAVSEPRSPPLIAGYRPGLSHEELIRRAEGVYRSPRAPATVSAYCEWVYDVHPGRMRHVSTSARSAALERGRVGEEAVELERKRRVLEWGARGNWSLVSSALGADRRVYDISRLVVDGAHLRGSPDYVFRHDHTGAAVVVEIKTSPKMPYQDAWPNARAQVWCYGQIDALKDAPEITLVVETWTPMGGGCTGRFLWRMSDPDFCARNQDLFDCYRTAMPHPRATSPGKPKTTSEDP